MRRRACAALLLCGPLVAGCGSATRLDFKGHSRPAAPAAISVYLGGGKPLVDPREVAPGPVLFNVSNQTGRPQSISIATPDGRRLAQSSVIPAGDTGQLKTALTRSAYAVELDGRPAAMTLVSTRGPARTGDNDLLQP